MRCQSDQTHKHQIMTSLRAQGVLKNQIPIQAIQAPAKAWKADSKLICPQERDFLANSDSALAGWKLNTPSVMEVDVDFMAADLPNLDKPCTLNTITSRSWLLRDLEVLSMPGDGDAAQGRKLKTSAC